MLVLAGTIQLSPWDKRYHQPVREGAEKIQVPGASDIPTEDRRRDYLELPSRNGRRPGSDGNGTASAGIPKSR